VRSPGGDAAGEPAPDTDGQLLVAALADQDAFGTFFDRNHERILAYFYRRTFCPHTSADLCAETFAQAWTSIRRYDPDAGTGRAWLFGIAGNLYRGWLRRGVVRGRARRRLGITTPDLTEDDLDRIDHLVDTSELREGLQAALSQLSREAYRAFSDAYAEGEPLACSGTLGRPLEQLAPHVEGLDVRVTPYEEGLPRGQVPLDEALESSLAAEPVTGATALSASDLHVSVGGPERREPPADC